MLPWILAGASIAGGYALLWTGATTVPAALLALGYCALIPWAIARRGASTAPRAGTPAPAADRPPYTAAAAAAVTVLALYVMTLAPTTAMWDTSEYLTAVKVLGLPHPPGNPMFVLLAHTFGAIPIVPDYAMRINLFAAISSAVAAACWYLVTFMALERIVPARAARHVGSAAAVALGATAFTVWNQSVVNEKVYTLSLAQIAFVTWLIVKWTHEAGSGGANRLLVLAAYLSALGYAVHPAGFLILPPLGVAVWLARNRLRPTRQFLAAAAVAFAIGLTPFAVEPIRAAYDPMLNEGEPTACAGKIGIGCTFSAETIARLGAYVGREQYGKPPLAERQAPFHAQLGMWWLYWKWQWFRDATGSAPWLQSTLALGALLLALIGARAQAMNDRAGFAVMAALVATVTVALVFYLNFKYGYSQAPELGGSVDREVRDRDYFFIWSFSALGVWMGIGLASVWAGLATRLPRRGLLRAAPVLGFALIPLALNWGAASRAGKHFTREWAHDALESAEPGAVILTGGDNDTFPLWYAQSVEGIRRDVTVLVSTYLGVDWAPWQLARRIPPPYDRAAGPALWRDVPDAPHRPVLAGSRAELDAIPYAMRIDTPQLFKHGSVRARVDTGYITREQILLLRIIQDSFPGRPVAFTNPGFPASTGLAAYIVRTGLLWRLAPAAVTEGGGVVRTAEGMLDLDRSLRLWREVYRGAGQVAREGVWIDDASISIPIQYVVAGSTMADALERSGRATEAAPIRRDVNAIYRATRLERFAVQR
jgi:hypothetical protein